MGRKRSSAKRGRRGGQGLWIAAVSSVMLGFLAWLLFEWTSYLRGSNWLLLIFGTVGASTVVVLLSFARRS